jgi:hypothetical protein
MLKSNGDTELHNITEPSAVNKSSNNCIFDVKTQSINMYEQI